MILWLITIGLIIIAFISFLISISNYSNFAEITALLSGCLAFFILIIILPMTIANHLDSYEDKEIMIAQMRYEAIQHQLELLEENSNENISKIEVINNIMEWNQEVYETKYWAENPWVNWINSQRIADSLKEIDYNGLR